MKAVLNLVEEMRTRFQFQFFGGVRLEASFPVAPYDDIFEAMTANQMKAFESKLTTLNKRLERAQACRSRKTSQALQLALGPDFPDIL